MRMRQSTLGDADICLRRLQFNLEAPRDVYHCNPARAIGTAYHAGLEYAYTVVGQGAKWPSLMSQCDVALVALEAEHEKAGDHFQWSKDYPDIASMMAVVSEMLAAYEPYRWQWQVVDVELVFDLPWIREHTRGGAMDLVLQDPNGWIVGVDHKTAGRMWPEKKSTARVSNQGPWYVAALKELFPDAPGHRFVFDVMTYAKKFERRICDPRPEHLVNIEHKALQVVSIVDGMRANGLDLPANPSSNLCSSEYCDWWNICPFGAQAV